MELKELYGKKGELTTQIEVYQARLQAVNNEIIKLINRISIPNVEKEDTKKKDKL